MPESEQKPKLIELVAPGAGQGWKAVLRSGKAVVVHEIPVPPAEAQAAAPRLQRLYDHRHPALSPVLAWGTDQNGVWVAVEPNEGTPLSTILSHGALTPPAAAALGAAVLSGVAALHEAGIAMGGFGATAVRVTSNGEVRLAGHPAAAVRGAPSQSDLRADVRSCGMAVCAAFGVDPAGAPAPANIPPGLVVTMRSMASGAMGPSADRAQGALREMASALLAPDRQMAAQSELATRSGGREVPMATPFLQQEQKPAEPAAPAAPSFATAATAASGAAQAPAPPPASFTPPVRRDETPVRHPASYEAPDRPLQTYPSMPAVVFPPAPPAPAPPVPEAPAASAPPAAPPVPTWSEAPARTESPLEAPAPAAPTKPPPAVQATNPPAPSFAPPEPKPAVPTWESAAPEAAPAAASAFATNPPAPAPVEPARPVEEPKPTWTPLAAPVWKPGEAVPAETLGAGVAAMTPTPPAPPDVPAPPVAPAPPPVFRPTPPPARRPPVARPTSDRPPSERPPWLIPAAVAAAIVVLLGAFGVIVLAGRGAPSSHPVAQNSPHASASARSSPTAAPSGKTPQAVPSFGPAAAAPITSVQFCTAATPCKIAVGIADETATACDLNSCTVEVAIYFSAGQKVPVHYNLKFFDRCSGQTTDLPGPPAYTPPGYAVVIPRDHWAVALPTGARSGALVAVTDQPATAASPPLYLGATDSC